MPYGVKQDPVMQLKISIGCITAAKWPQWYSIENATIIHQDTWANQQSYHETMPNAWNISEIKIFPI